MADDLGVQLFTAGQEQHTAARRWLAIAAVILAWFHFLVVLPFVSLSRQHEAIQAELKLHGDLNDAVQQILAQNDQLIKSAQAKTTAASQALLDDLVGRLGRVNTAMAELHELGLDRAESDAGAAVFDSTPGAHAQPMQQVRQPVPTGRPALPIMPPELRRKVAESSNDPARRDQLLDLITPYVNDAIIHPAFVQANDAWHRGTLPTLTGDADRVHKLIESAPAGDAAVTAALKRLDSQLTAITTSAAGISFAPPSNPDWWRSLAEKERTVREVFETLAREVPGLAQQSAALQAIRSQTDAALAQQQDLQRSIERAMAELETETRKLGEQLGEIASPLKVVSVDLATGTRLLPLFIGLVFSVLTVWSANGLRKMGLAKTGIGDAAQARTADAWIHYATGGSAVSVVRNSILPALLAGAWVVAASFSASGVAKTTAAATLSIAGLALLAVAAAAAYHWRSAMSALPSVPESHA
jgi:hypothetical protein